MGTRSLIQLCVRNKDGELVVFAVIFSQWDGFYQCLGVRLASFLEIAKNGSSQLFPSIITYLKNSSENAESPYMYPPDTECKLDTFIEYVYRVIVEENHGSQGILFEAEGGRIEDEKTGKIIPDNFSGSPADFVKKYAHENDPYLYKPVLPHKERTRLYKLVLSHNEQLDVEKYTLVKKIKEVANSFDDHDVGFTGRIKRDQLVALLDALVYQTGW
jgi:hypothetical protein